MTAGSGGRTPQLPVPGFGRCTGPADAGKVEEIEARMSLFDVTIIAAGACLLMGVIFVIRGRPFAGILAILVAIAVAGFGFREDILGDDGDDMPTMTATSEGTPVP